MKNLLPYLIPFSFMALAAVCLSCGGGGSNDGGSTSGGDVATLTVSKSDYTISATDTKVTLNVTSTDKYYVRSKGTWVVPSTTQESTASTFDLSVAENGYMDRIDTVTVTSGKLTQTVYITQTMKSVPAIADDQTGMTSNALTLAHQINIGWNLGNTLESNNNYFSGSETMWGNPKTTQDMITAVKNAGFNAVRIPVCWGAHLSDVTNWTIDADWLARVKEVVDYAYSQGLYIILNSHHDGWFEFDCNASDSSLVRKKEVSMWTQIALKFRDYDEHLIFAGMNEPHQGNDWGSPSGEHAAVESYYEQVFVNTVRATGGRNAYRCLMVQPWCCNPSYMSSLKQPADKAANRIILEFHYYTPWNFCGTDGTDCVRFWGDDYKSYGTLSTYGTAESIKSDFATLKSTYIDKGIPVIMGEFGVNRHTFTETEITSGLQAKGEESRDYYLKWLVSTAHSYGIPLFYWDNGALGAATTSAVMGSGSNAFALFDRKSTPTAMAIYDSGAVKALLEGAKTSY
jgi:endoglucanase